MVYYGDWESFHLDATSKCIICFTTFTHMCSTLVILKGGMVCETIFRHFCFTYSLIPTGCKYPGCTRPRYRESYGYVHEFCGKTHATAYSWLMSDKMSSYQNGCNYSVTISCNCMCILIC